MKGKQTDYNKCVNEAKKVVSLLRLKNVHRVKVAKLAIVAVKIQHGGRAALNRNTLASFADKIGVNKGTLYEWCRYKRGVYDKLTKEQKSQYNEVSADTIKRLLNGGPINSDSSALKVQREFARVVKSGPVEAKLYKYAKVLDTIIYNLKSFDKASEVPDEILKDYIMKSRLIIGLGEKTLEFKSGRKKAPKVSIPKIDWDNFWQEEVGI